MGIAFPRKLRSVHCQDLNPGSVNLHSWAKTRPFNLMGTVAFLGLAFCVFTWGLQYKLSLYDPPQDASHQVPKAKLLSRDERSDVTESPLVVRTKLSTRVIYTLPVVEFFILVLIACKLDLPLSGQRLQRASLVWHLRPACLDTYFVRPPPVLA